MGIGQNFHIVAPLAEPLLFHMCDGGEEFSETEEGPPSHVHHTPSRLHSFTRFSRVSPVQQCAVHSIMQMSSWLTLPAKCLIDIFHPVQLALLAEVCSPEA